MLLFLLLPWRGTTSTINNEHFQRVRTKSISAETERVDRKFKGMSIEYGSGTTQEAQPKEDIRTWVHVMGG